MNAIEGAFGTEIDYAQLVKLFGAAPESAKGRYSPAECTGIKKTAKIGEPEEKHVSTSDQLGAPLGGVRVANGTILLGKDLTPPRRPGWG